MLKLDKHLSLRPLVHFPMIPYILELLEFRNYNLQGPGETKAVDFNRALEIDIIQGRGDIESCTLYVPRKDVAKADLVSNVCSKKRRGKGRLGLKWCNFYHITVVHTTGELGGANIHFSRRWPPPN